MATALSGIRACVFDAYGTLFDYASAARRLPRCAGRPYRPADRAVARQAAAIYVAAHIQGRHADFWLVTGDTLDFALGSLGLDDPQLRVRLMDPYRTLDAFPEVSEVLKRLKAAGLVTAILSNGSPDMLDAAMKKAGIESLLDAVLSVELAGVYEPHPNVYQLAVDRLGIPADSISFQSSNAWDAYAASALGMRVVWCNRYGQRPERLPGKPNCEIVSLPELVGA